MAKFQAFSRSAKRFQDIGTVYRKSVLYMYPPLKHKNTNFPPTFPSFDILRHYLTLDELKKTLTALFFNNDLNKNISVPQQWLGTNFSIPFKIPFNKYLLKNRLKVISKKTTNMQKLYKVDCNLKIQGFFQVPTYEKSPFFEGISDLEKNPKIPGFPGGIWVLSALLLQALTNYRHLLQRWANTRNVTLHTKSYRWKTCLLQRRANAWNVSYTPNPIGKNMPASTKG